jgi:hypothetical protein
MDHDNRPGSGLDEALPTPSNPSSTAKETQFDIAWGSGYTDSSGRPSDASDMKKRSNSRRGSFFKKHKQALSRALGIGVVVLIALYFSLIRPALALKTSLNKVAAAGRELKAAGKENDIDLIKKKMQGVSTAYKDVERDAKGLYWASFIPYVADLKNGIEAGRYSLTAGEQGIDAIAPYADLLGFKKGEASFVDKSAEDRLQFAVLTLDKLVKNLDPISKNIEAADIRLNKINPNRYPEKLGTSEVRSRIVNIKAQFNGITSLFVDAKPLLKQLPEILGKDDEKTYLILFQNNNERRATGGFLTSYAFFNIKDGRIKIERSEDIYSMDALISNHPAAPPEILTYHKGVSKFYVRDSNLSPDLPTSIKLFESLYKKSSIDKSYDGIITIDSKVLVDMLRIFGDTEVDGITFSANEDQRCGCPQVIYQLFDLVDRPVNYIKTDRKGILGDLMYALFYKAIGFSPSKYWGTLVQQMYENLNEKHIMMNFKDKSLQEAAERVNFAGRIRMTDGDFLHVNGVNFAGAKSNLFIHEQIVSKTTQKDNRLAREVTITYRNPAAHSDCNLERGGLCLNATLRNWVRIYVPKGSKLDKFVGSQMPVKTYDELDKTVFEGFMTVEPKGLAKVSVTYTLPERITRDNYSILVEKQAGVEKDKQSLEVDFLDKQLFNGPFATDQMLKP